MTIKGKKTQVWVTILLLLFVSFQAQRMMFFHTHVYGNVIVSHSHPFSTNQHTGSDLQSIAALDMVVMIDDINPDIELPLPIEFRISTCIHSTCNIRTGYLCLNQGRDPPYTKI